MVKVIGDPIQGYEQADETSLVEGGVYRIKEGTPVAHFYEYDGESFIVYGKTNFFPGAEIIVEDPDLEEYDKMDGSGTVSGFLVLSGEHLYVMVDGDYTLEKVESEN